MHTAPPPRKICPGMISTPSALTFDASTTGIRPLPHRYRSAALTPLGGCEKFKCRRDRAAGQDKAPRRLPSAPPNPINRPSWAAEQLAARSHRPEIQAPSRNFAAASSCKMRSPSLSKPLQRHVEAAQPLPASAATTPHSNQTHLVKPTPPFRSSTVRKIKDPAAASSSSHPPQRIAQR